MRSFFLNEDYKREVFSTEEFLTSNLFAEAAANSPRYEDYLRMQSDLLTPSGGYTLINNTQATALNTILGGEEFTGDMRLGQVDWSGEILEKLSSDKATPQTRAAVKSLLAEGSTFFRAPISGEVQDAHSASNLRFAFVTTAYP